MKLLSTGNQSVWESSDLQETILGGSAPVWPTLIQIWLSCVASAGVPWTRASSAEDPQEQQGHLQIPRKWQGTRLGSVSFFPKGNWDLDLKNSKATLLIMINCLLKRSDIENLVPLSVMCSLEIFADKNLRSSRGYSQFYDASVPLACQFWCAWSDLELL